MIEVVDDEDEYDIEEVDGSKFKNLFDVRGGLFDNEESHSDCQGSLLIFHLPANAEMVKTIFFNVQLQ